MAAFDPRDFAAENSPVLEKLAAPASQVARRDGPWVRVLGVLAVAFIGIVVFSALSQDRQAKAQTSAVIRPAATAQAPVLMPQVSALAPAPQIAPASQPFAAAPQPDPAAQWRSPAMVVDMGDDAAASGLARASQAAGPAPALPDAHLSADERFAERVAGSSAETTRATRLRDTALIAPQGTVIPAILETAINLDLPGFARAVVSRDVRGFDGSTVLIPRGSHLIGQYRGGVAVGQSRAFIVWSRVLTPTGVSIDIASPGGDRLGRGGLEGETNTHFFQRFGGAILLSVLSSGLDAVATGGHGTSTAITIGSPQQATNVAAIALQKQIDIPPTITVSQGAPIRIFVARDLDFSGVVARAP